MFTGDLNFALDVAKSLTQPLSGVGGRARQAEQAETIIARLLPAC